MPTLTIYDVPEEVLAYYRARAKAARRSMNSEIVVQLQRLARQGAAGLMADGCARPPEAPPNPERLADRQRLVREMRESVATMKPFSWSAEQIDHDIDDATAWDGFGDQRP